MLGFVVNHAFAGLWTLVWHFGVAIGVAILCVVGAIFADRFGFTRLAKILVGCAIVAVALFTGEVIGVRGEKARCDAQAATVTKFSNGVVNSTTTKKSRAAKDPFNSPGN